MLGVYRILSAITNPTGKNRLEAGIKGRIIRERLCIKKNIPRREKFTQKTKVKDLTKAEKGSE